MFYGVNTGFANLYSLKHKYNFNKAKYYYHKNLEKALKDKDSMMIANTSLNLGELYLKTNNDSCIYFFNKSIQHDLVNQIDINETYRNIANYYIKNGNRLKALISINKY